MLNNEIIQLFIQWLERNLEIERKYREKIEKDFSKYGVYLFGMPLYQLWLIEANIEEYPLVLIDYDDDKVELYLAYEYIDEHLDEEQDKARFKGNFFAGYLICTFIDGLIKPSNDMERKEFNRDLWDCSIGIESPNEISIYEESEYDKEGIMENIKFARHNIDVFYSTNYKAYYYAFFGITDFDNDYRIMSYEQFLDYMIMEAKVTFPKYEKRNDIGQTFKLYYLENEELKPLTKENYDSVMEIPKIQVFFTEDKESALELYNQMMKQNKEWELKIMENTERHEKFIDSIK